jgi:hypothetical protein
VEGPQGVRRPGYEFHLRTLRGDSNHVFTGQSARLAQSHARCVQAERGLGFYQLKREIERLLLQEVHRVKDPNNQRLFENFPQGVHAETLLEAFSSQEKAQKG